VLQSKTLYRKANLLCGTKSRGRRAGTGPGAGRRPTVIHAGPARIATLGMIALQALIGGPP